MARTSTSSLHVTVHLLFLSLQMTKKPFIHKDLGEDAGDWYQDS
jgi:hypothetical protein